MDQENKQYMATFIATLQTKVTALIHEVVRVETERDLAQQETKAMQQKIAELEAELFDQLKDQQ